MKQTEGKNDNVLKLVFTGLMTALITVATMALPIPIPGTTGYVNLGDGIIFLSVFILGWQYAAFAGGVGAGLADLLLGAAIWSPWTLVVKAGMAFICGFCIQHHPGGFSKKICGMPVYAVMGMAISTCWMTAGYYVAEAVIYGNWIAPVIGVPWNLLQGVVGLVLASVLAVALEKTSARRYFTYKI